MSITETPTFTLRERMAKARQHSGLDRHQMADALGVTERTVRNWEHGSVQVTRATVLAYASVTNVPVWWIEGDYPDEMRVTDTYTTPLKPAA